MDIFTDTIRDLPVADKMLLVQRIWDDLSSTADTVPLPQWALSEASRRRDEMRANPANPGLGKTHDEFWTRINDWRNG